jgi:hypothetical protein
VTVDKRNDGLELLDELGKMLILYNVNGWKFRKRRVRDDKTKEAAGRAGAATPSKIERGLHRRPVAEAV